MEGSWSGQKIVVIGAARQGIALTRYLVEHGAHVILNDHQLLEDLTTAQKALSDLTASGALEWLCGGHPLDLLKDADLVCPSGGVPLTLPLIVEAHRRGIPLSNDTQVFMAAAPCPVVGITGSAGKTTTTTLVGRILQAAVDQNQPGFGGRKIWVGGNIGLPMVAFLDQIMPDDLVVIELSSFQLEIMDSSPDTASILNITPNHLDRHFTMQAYTAAKRRILDFQSEQDTAVLGRDDPGAWALASEVKGRLFSFGVTPMPKDGAGVSLMREGLRLHLPDQPEVHVMARDQVSVRGDHNLQNVMAACAISAAVGAPVEAMRAGVEGFNGVAHRLEFVRTWGGADWYNDSMATAPERAMAAIRSFDEPLVLLAGGRDKDLPWNEFAALVRERVDHLVLFGEAAAIIDQAIGSMGATTLKITRCVGLKAAVAAAAEIVRPGDVVLLSPGGTSFDEFIDFEERGVCFVQWVNELP
jgi:UDP-N-acetylmuramoylalanine--D-glutamate ligase